MRPLSSGALVRDRSNLRDLPLTIQSPLEFLTEKDGYLKTLLLLAISLVEFLSHVGTEVLVPRALVVGLRAKGAEHKDSASAMFLGL